MNVKVTSYAFSKGNVILYPIQVNFFFIETYHNCKLFKTDLNAYHYGDIGLPAIHFWLILLKTVHWNLRL